MGKKWYLSKGLWIGFITFVYSILIYVGFVTDQLSPEMITTILGILVVVIRLLTKEPVTWQEKK